MNKLSRLSLSGVAVAILAIPDLAQSAATATQLEDPHQWYWLGHWHLWHGGWAYWWTIPLLVLLVGAAMFYLGRLSAGSSRKPPSDPGR